MLSSAAWVYSPPCCHGSYAARESAAVSSSQDVTLDSTRLGRLICGPSARLLQVRHEQGNIEHGRSSVQLPDGTHTHLQRLSAICTAHAAINVLSTRTISHRRRQVMQASYYILCAARRTGSAGNVVQPGLQQRALVQLQGSRPMPARSWCCAGVSACPSSLPAGPGALLLRQGPAAAYAVAPSACTT